MTILRVFAVLLLTLLVGCAPPDAPTVTRLRIGVEPDQSPEALTQRYQPFIAYLEQELGLDCELIVPNSYADLVDRIERHEVDLAYLGGAIFLQARSRAGVIPLAMRDADLNFYSYVVVRKDDPAQSLSDLRGRSLSFGSELSTSGHFMPRYFFEEHGIQVDDHFSTIEFSGPHDVTVKRVRDGEIDAGAVNGRIVDAMLRDGRLSGDAVRILWRSPPYPNYVWAIRPEIGKQLGDAVNLAFLNLSYDLPRHARILDAVDSKGLLPVEVGDFSELSRILDSHGQLNGKPL